jgi:hypothetical protein
MYAWNSWWVEQRGGIDLRFRKKTTEILAGQSNQTAGDKGCTQATQRDKELPEEIQRKETKLALTK